MNSNQTSPPTGWCEGCKTNWASHWRTATNHQPPGHPTKASDCSVQRRVSSVTVAVKLHAFRPKLLSWFPKLSCRVENDMEIEHIAQHSTNLDLHRSTKWFIGSYIIGIPWCSIRTLWKAMERISYCSHGYLPIRRASILATSKTPPGSPLNFCTWRLRARIPQQLKICKVSTCRTILAVEDYLKEKKTFDCVKSLWLPFQNPMTFVGEPPSLRKKRAAVWKHGMGSDVPHFPTVVLSTKASQTKHTSLPKTLFK